MLTYEGTLVEGVTRFQRRHGLESDGVLGSRTRAALSVPLSWRVRQIELALERLRWLPHLGEDRFLAVNIPMFRVWGVEGFAVGVNLSRPIRVILFYMTAVVMPEDGAVHFAEDIYGHDARLDEHLTRRSAS